MDAAVVRSFVGDGARALLHARCVRRPGRRRADAAFDAYVGHHAEQRTRACRLFDGVAEHDLVDRGHPIAVVTNKPERFARSVVAHLGLDASPTSSSAGTRCRPEARPGDALARPRAARRPLGGATMVGDSLQDLVAGKALGARTVACLFGHSAPDALRAEGADEHRSPGVRA